MSGPKGKGTLYPEAHKRAGLWHIEVLQFGSENSDERIDLMGAVAEPSQPRRSFILRDKSPSLPMSTVSSTFRTAKPVRYALVIKNADFVRGGSLSGLLFPLTMLTQLKKNPCRLIYARNSNGL